MKIRALRLILPALLALSTEVIAADYTLRIHHFLNKDSLPQTGLMEPWAEQVEKDSGGRIKVKIYPKMDLGGKTHELVDQVQEGTVDIVWTAAAYTPNKFPHAEVFTLPLVHNGDPAATNQAMMSLIDSVLAEDFKGVKPLLAHVQAGHSLHMSRKTIRKMSELDGLTIRPAGRRVGLWTTDKLGANPSRKRHPKLSDAIADNKLDGALMSFQLAQSIEVLEAAHSHTMLSEDNYFGTSLYLFLMNQDSYNALPEDLQAVIDKNSGMALAKQSGDVWHEAEVEAIELARKHGHDVIVLDEDEQQLVGQALGDILDRWSATVTKYGINGPELIGQAREAISQFQ